MSKSTEFTLSSDEKEREPLTHLIPSFPLSNDWMKLGILRRLEHKKGVEISLGLAVTLRLKANGGGR